MKKILITTAREKSTRELLRSKLFDLITEKYEVIITSPAEVLPEWKKEFEKDNVTFLREYSQEIYKNPMKGLTNIGVGLVISTCNNDVPAHAFDVSFQVQAQREGIQFLLIQDFIDYIFHPMVTIPDRICTWGNFFTDYLSKSRDVLVWGNNNIGAGIIGHGGVEGLPKDIFTVCGSIHFDDYIDYDMGSRESLCKELDLNIDKPIFLYTPTGCNGEWVFETAKDFFKAAERHQAQVILKAHPMKHEDKDRYDEIAIQFPNNEYRFVVNKQSGDKYEVDGYDKDFQFRLDYTDSIQLGSLLKNVDLVGSIGSTANVEGMIFNTPTVLNKTHWSNPMPVREKIMNWYWDLLGEEYHCCDIATNTEQLFEMVDNNYKNPSHNSEGRKHIVNDFFGEQDGKASERVFEVIKDMMNG